MKSLSEVERIILTSARKIVDMKSVIDEAAEQESKPSWSNLFSSLGWAQFATARTKYPKNKTTDLIYNRQQWIILGDIIELVLKWGLDLLVHIITESLVEDPLNNVDLEL